MLFVFKTVFYLGGQAFTELTCTFDYEALNKMWLLH